MLRYDRMQALQQRRVFGLQAYPVATQGFNIGGGAEIDGEFIFARRRLVRRRGRDTDRRQRDRSA